MSDLAQGILTPATGLSNDAKADLWDAFNSSSNGDELGQKLQAAKFVHVDDGIKASLWDAKNDPDRFSLAHATPATVPGVAAPVNPITQDATPEQYAKMTPAQQQAFDQNIAGNRSVTEPLVGAGKSILSAVNTVRSMVGSTPSEQAKQDAELTSPMQKAGAGIEQGAEFELGGALLESLSHLPLAERLLQTGKVLDLVKAHPVLAAAAALGGTVGGLHEGKEGAAVGALTGGAVGAVSEAPSAIKELWGSLDGQEIQKELQTGWWTNGYIWTQEKARRNFGTLG